MRGVGKKFASHTCAVSFRGHVGKDDHGYAVFETAHGVGIYLSVVFKLTGHSAAVGEQFLYIFVPSSVGGQESISASFGFRHAEDGGGSFVAERYGTVGGAQDDDSVHNMVEYIVKALLAAFGFAQCLLESFAYVVYAAYDGVQFVIARVGQDGLIASVFHLTQVFTYLFDGVKQFHAENHADD